MEFAVRRFLGVKTIGKLECINLWVRLSFHYKMMPVLVFHAITDLDVKVRDPRYSPESQKEPRPDRISLRVDVL